MEEDNQTAFQTDAISRAQETLRALHVDLTAFNSEKGREGHYYFASIQLGAHVLSIYIYEDEAEFSIDDDAVDCRFEKYDYDSPDALVSAFVTALRFEIEQLRK